jgi:hypothetical protein
MATGDSTGAPAKGVPAAAGEGAEMPEALGNEQLAPTARGGRSALGDHGNGDEAPEAPVGAANMAVVDAGLGERPAPSAREALPDGTGAWLGEAMRRTSEPAVWLVPTSRGVQSLSVRKSKWDEGGVESSTNGKADSSNAT